MKIWNVEYEYGMWREEYQEWRMENGIWNMEYEYEIWNVEYGMWKVECGM